MPKNVPLLMWQLNVSKNVSTANVSTECVEECVNCVIEIAAHMLNLALIHPCLLALAKNYRDPSYRQHLILLTVLITNQFCMRKYVQACDSDGLDWKCGVRTTQLYELRQILNAAYTAPPQQQQPFRPTHITVYRLLLNIIETQGGSCFRCTDGLKISRISDSEIWQPVASEWLPRLQGWI